MSTARLQWLWSKLSRGYECASDGVTHVLASKEYARVKTYANIAICSTMAVGYFAHIGRTSESETSDLPHPAEYVMTAVVCGIWSAWEYKKGASAQTEEEMLADSENVIKDVDRLYSTVISHMEEEKKELQKNYNIESKPIPRISDDVVLPAVPVTQQLFDSKLVVYMRAMMNGGVIATTVYQYMNAGWLRNLFLSTSMMGASLWYNDSIRAAIANRKKFAKVQASFPIAKKKLEFIDSYMMKKSNLTTTARQISIATDGHINIGRISTTATIPAVQSSCVEAGKTALSRSTRAVLRSASQAESLRILSRIMLPVIAPSGEHIVGGVVLLFGAPRAYFKEQNAMRWSHELKEFTAGMVGTVENIRYVDSVLSTGRLVLKEEVARPIASSSSEEKIAPESNEDEADALLGTNFDEMPEIERDLESGAVNNISSVSAPLSPSFFKTSQFSPLVTSHAVLPRYS